MDGISMRPHRPRPRAVRLLVASGLRRDNIVTIFGSKAADAMEPLHVEEPDSGVIIAGYVSKATAGSGRASGEWSVNQLRSCTVQHGHRAVGPHLLWVPGHP